MGMTKRNPVIDKEQFQDSAMLQKKLVKLESKLKLTKEAIIVEELECDRTFNRYSNMLQDKMVLISTIDDTTRNLNFMRSLTISQQAFVNPHSGQYEEVFAQAQLHIEQEAVAKNIIISNLEKKEDISRNERMEAVGFFNLRALSVRVSAEK